jgi:multicomponent K+:H+ antiporter subunit D
LKVSWIGPHLIVLPVVLPLLAGALMLALGREALRSLVAAISVVSTFLLVAVAVALIKAADAGDGALAGVYRLGDWPVPFAIVLVVDRLSALMVLLTSVIAAAAVVFSIARWQRAGAFFHPLFQFLLMGLNGAFLTGDLFNLFVFFEVLLAASYGLALHGSGSTRVTAAQHYIAINLVASLLFLVGVSLIYGVTGTLNMADIAVRIATAGNSDRALIEAGAGILGIAFLVKAGMWPLCFWLPATYASAAPPAASVFSLLTKVGAYVVLRLWLMLFGADAGPSAQYGAEWLLLGGMVTVAFGAIGTLASQDVARVCAFSVLVSTGTVLAAIGMGHVGTTGGALFYLVSSTLGIAALFLLIELVERREPGAEPAVPQREAFREEAYADEQEVGIAIPASMGVLGIAFIACTAVISGLPPLSGFIAKFALLRDALNAAGPQSGSVSAATWAWMTVLIISGLAALVALTRAGIDLFWASPGQTAPRVRLIEMAPVAMLLLLCAMQTIEAGPVMRFMQATAQSLHAPRHYIRDVLGPSADRLGPREGGT